MSKSKRDMKKESLKNIRMIKMKTGTLEKDVEVLKSNDTSAAHWRLLTRDIEIIMELLTDVNEAVFLDEL